MVAVEEGDGLAVQAVDALATADHLPDRREGGEVVFALVDLFLVVRGLLPGSGVASSAASRSTVIASLR